jgi:murein DD-endopeptidase MepM/ murein hydrolase activator NlpD
MSEGLLTVLGRSSARTSRAAGRAAPPASPVPRLVWPVPVYQGRRPVVSSGWGAPRDDGARSHKGVDVMYPRQRGELPEYKPGTPSATEDHFLPSNIPAVAVAAGRVKFAARTRRGYSVIIDHGDDATYYTHLVNLFVPEADDWRGTARVEAGAPLGIIGGDPSRGPGALKHLHFEIWRGGKRSGAINPLPAMRHWGVMRLVDALAMLDGTVRAA